MPRLASPPPWEITLWGHLLRTLAPMISCQWRGVKRIWLLSWKAAPWGARPSRLLPEVPAHGAEARRAAASVCTPGKEPVGRVVCTASDICLWGPGAATSGRVPSGGAGSSPYSVVRDSSAPSLKSRSQGGQRWKTLLSRREMSSGSCVVHQTGLMPSLFTLRGASLEGHLSATLG